MLPGEVTPAAGVRLARPLVAAELRVLSYLPVGVGAEQVGVAERVVEGGGPIEGRRDAGKDLLQALERVLGVGRQHRGVAERGSLVAARVVDQDPGRAALPPADIPAVLVGEIGERVTGRDAPGTALVPQPPAELHVQLAVAPVAQLLDGGLLQAVEAGPGVARPAGKDGAQHREGHGQDHTVRHRGRFLVPP